MIYLLEEFFIKIKLKLICSDIYNGVLNWADQKYGFWAFSEIMLMKVTLPPLHFLASTFISGLGKKENKHIKVVCGLF